MDLVTARLRHHLLSTPANDVAAAATRMCATQAQEFWGGRWALALRTRGDVRTDQMDAAFDSGVLVRSWPMRGTLHVMAAEDLRWVTALTAPRVLSALGRRHRELGITEADLGRAADVLCNALGSSGLIRSQVFRALNEAGVDTAGQRGTHLISTLAMRGLVCWGPIEAREQRLVLVDDWIDGHTEPDDPLTELFVRYILGHGPATAADFAWWSRLTLTSAREAATRARHDPRLLHTVCDGPDLFSDAAAPPLGTAPQVLLLPSFDEYYLSYSDRTGAATPEQATLIGPGRNGMVKATVLYRGRVAGTWTRTEVTPELFDPEAVPAPDLEAAVARYRHYAGI